MRIQFASFTLDFDTRQLTQGRSVIDLAPKAFELLTVLVVASPKVLAKSELQQRLWPNTFVAEANLSNLVSEIRSALGDSARRPLFVRTAHGFGYAFCADVRRLPATEPAASPRPAFWLEWGQRRFPLSSGAHVIGRDPAAEVTLEASTVSRRHARIVVSGDGAVLEDFTSKNGTFCRNERVTSPIALVDGDAILIGAVMLTFHARGAVDSTETRGATAPQSKV